MSRIMKILLLLILLTVSVIPFSSQAQEERPTVYAVLFYSSTCPYCEQVISEVLPPLVEKYGLQLQIFAVNTSTATGNNLYQATIEAFEIPTERRGVPTLIVGEQILVGSMDIPQRFPSIIEEGLTQGGIDWPTIPGLEEARTNSNPQESPTSAEELSVIEKFKQDTAGNTLSIIVLLGMIATLITLGINFEKPPAANLAEEYRWLVPLLTIVGAGIAGYLSFVEATQTDAVCGPVGHCNEVQQSPYATLFGFFPVGLLGLIGFIAILLTQIIQYYSSEKWRQQIATVFWGLTVVGVLFSIYLTFLEPFVIGASCLWCLSSAVIMTLLLWISTNGAKHAWMQQQNANHEE